MIAGSRHTSEARKKMREARKLVPNLSYRQTREWKSNIAAARRYGPLSESTKQKIGEARRIFFQTGGKHWALGKPMSELAKSKISASRKGQAVTAETKRKISATLTGSSHTEATRRKISEANKRKVAAGTHNFWKGGRTTENFLARSSVDYKLWRTAVYRRDNFACVICGNRGRLEADHIKPFSSFPELRFDVSNGRTLCRQCHIKTPTYGRGALSN